MTEIVTLFSAASSLKDYSSLRLPETAAINVILLKTLIVKPLILLLVAGSLASGSNGADQLQQPTTGRPEVSLDPLNREHEQSQSSSSNLLFDIQVGRDFFTLGQMETVQRIYFQSDDFHKKSNFSSWFLDWMTAKAHSVVFDDLLTHGYDSINELRESLGPEVDNEKCLMHLSELVERSHQATREQYSSRDINFHQLLDTFGRTRTGVSMGNLFWPGMFDECLRLKIVTSTNEKLGTRYCLAAIRHKQWPKGTPFSAMSVVENGICLPKSCDSLRYKNKYELIHQLVEFNYRRMDMNETEIDRIYCPPDESSTSRAWWTSPKFLLAATVIAIWLSILIHATIRYEQSQKIESQTNQKDKRHSPVGSNSSKSAQKVHEMDQQVAVERKCPQIFELLSIKQNLKSLCGTRRRPVNRKSSDEHVQKHEPIVDLSCLEGIKVICMFYMITGHMLMCFSSLMSNFRSLTYSFKPVFQLNNMTPFFAVNSFFTITGILTSYFMFKQNKPHSSITNPIKWAAVILLRYLRIMPMYLIVVYYLKYLAKFTSSGPLWDYGTSSLGPRRHCEQESWLWTLMFGANFKGPLEHCVVAAWYLANDFQFVMTAPIFLIALHKSPLFGQRLLKAGILAGYLAGIWKILSTDASDLRPVARAWPHGFKTYGTLLIDSYTRPQYRIPAYLCGLLFGYTLYTYEQDKLKFRATISDKPEARATLQEPGWSPMFIKYGMKSSLVLVTFLSLYPIIELISLDRFYSKLLVALLMSTNHIIAALATGSFILLASTGYGNKSLNNFLSASIFKSLGKLSLCVALINVEVCYYLFTSHRELKFYNNSENTALNLLSIVISYLIAFVLYILFEAPINKLISTLTAKLK